MKKFTYNMTAGITYSFPSCKTFVFLRTDYDVSFKFISLWNKIDKEIEGFKDSFSITAEEYFLQIRVVSSVNQEVSAILIDDSKVQYQPIMGEVTISNTPLPVDMTNQVVDVDIQNDLINVHLDNANPNDVNITNATANRAGVHSYNVNSENYPMPVYSPEGVMCDTKINSDKFYRGLYANTDGYLGKHKGWGYFESQQALTDLECYCIFPWVRQLDNNPLYEEGYLTYLEVTPETDDFLELWVGSSTASSTHDFDTLVGSFVNPDGKVKLTTNTTAIESEVWYKNITRAALAAIPYENLLCSFKITAGEPFVLPMAKPIRLDASYGSHARLIREFVTITTRTNCNFSFNAQIELHEQKYNTNSYFAPRSFP